jgi:exopolysaccharide production protein ExoQ
VNPGLASIIFAGGIAGLFLLNRDSTVRTSKALWIPVVWLFIAGSRTPSAWFQSPTQMSGADQFLGGNPFERNLFSVLLSLGILVLLNRPRRIAEVLKGNTPILLFIFYCALSLFWSGYPDVGFKRWIKLVGDLVMVLIVTTDIDPSAAFDRLITRVGFLTVPISILFIRYYPGLGRSYEAWTGAMHWTGITTNKNTLGLICMLIGLQTLWRGIHAFRSSNGKSRIRALIVNGAMLLMVVYLLHAANSATSTSCFVLGSILIVAISLFRSGRKPVMVHLLALGGVSLAASAAFFNLAGLLQQLGRNSDLTGRAEIWSIVLSQPVNRLFGAGYESFWLGERLATIQRLSEQYINQCHNGYIEVLVNLGWVGVALLALIIVAGYGKIVRAIRQNPEKNCIRLAYLVAAVVYNFTEASFKMLSPVWICFVWAIVSAPAESGINVQYLRAVPLPTFPSRNSMPVLADAPKARGNK